MEISNWNRIFEENQKQLSDILDDCQQGADELVLLANKMMPLMDEIGQLQEQINNELLSACGNDAQKNVHKVSEDGVPSN